MRNQVRVLDGRLARLDEEVDLGAAVCDARQELPIGDGPSQDGQRRETGLDGDDANGGLLPDPSTGAGRARGHQHRHQKLRSHGTFQVRVASMQYGSTSPILPSGETGT